MDPKSKIGRYDSNPNTLENQLRLKKLVATSFDARQLAGISSKRQAANASSLLNYNNSVLADLQANNHRSQVNLSLANSPKVKRKNVVAELTPNESPK